MKNLSERAADVAARVYRGRAATFNPMLIPVIINVVIDVVKLYRSCQQLSPSPSEAARRGRPLFANRVHRYARRALQRQNMDVALHAPVADEVLAELAGMSDPEILAVARQAESQTF